MRYQVIDVYHKHNLKHYIAKCLQPHSPQFIVIQSPRILCLDLDILDVSEDHQHASSAMGEHIGLKVLTHFDSFDKTYMSRN
ncbi:hypothetical protein [Acinetobacter sp.]|uniref:hypothetical protein n=1 Tax=Acinetobacter sp. TaxID=472 RepID=UPI00388E7574